MGEVIATTLTHWPAIVPVLVVFLIAAASPGPATLGIMGTAMAHGRAAGTSFAAGVQVGSATWATTAGIGLTAWLNTLAWGLTALKIAGALYLFWLGWKSLRNAMRRDHAVRAPGRQTTLRGHFGRGALIHLTNPKSVLAWMAIVTLTQTTGGGTTVLVVTLVLCQLIAITVFQGYALIFASPAMMAGYRRARRVIEALLAAVFGAAGARLLATA